MDNTDHWCFAWFANLPGAGKDRAALVRDAKWSSGDIITTLIAR